MILCYLMLPFIRFHQQSKKLNEQQTPPKEQKNELFSQLLQSIMKIFDECFDSHTPIPNKRLFHSSLTQLSQSSSLPLSTRRDVDRCLTSLKYVEEGPFAVVETSQVDLMESKDQTIAELKQQIAHLTPLEHELKRKTDEAKERERELEGRVEDTKKEYETKLRIQKVENDEKLSNLKIENEEKMKALKEENEANLREIEEQIEHTRKENEAKIASIRKEHEEKMQQMKKVNEQKLQAMKDENKFKFENFRREMEAGKVEYESRIAGMREENEQKISKIRKELEESRSELDILKSQRKEYDMVDDAFCDSYDYFNDD
ncbi:hypothetical protein BLNAU_17725 [Blattamonas nauphoetae]|uniref:Uncharacterized protein n=1 Tax=Blattamonas nauphoetae TaxID=2049346 RepID=A0ABQ9X6V7_9EUKA|nr:hypothetical protein BLNAU_17725 [Blattamonas nauphoetae]